MNTRKENVINIDGSKLKALLEGATGKTLKEISLENGYSDSFLRMVVKSGKATPTAQAVIKLYGIEPSAYEVKPETPETEPATSDDRQLTIDDILAPDVKEVLRQFINEAVTESFNTVFESVIKNERHLGFKLGYEEAKKLYCKPESIKAKHPDEIKGAGDKWAI